MRIPFDKWHADFLEIVQKATPGPWNTFEWGDGSTPAECLNVGAPKHEVTICTGIVGIDARFIAAFNPETVGRLLELLKEAKDALGCASKMVHYFPPTHVFQPGSDAEDLQDRAIKVYQECRKAYDALTKGPEALP